MILRGEIIQAARNYLGTPYLHQGRVRGPEGGVDCVGLCVCVARDLGIVAPDWDITGYRRLPDGFSLMHHLRESMAAEVSDFEFGDLIVLTYDRLPHHVGIVGDYHGGGFSLIHANGAARCVEERPLVYGQGMEFVTAFRFKGVSTERAPGIA
jgi:cell wall-associated NlpC family hydrolase